MKTKRYDNISRKTKKKLKPVYLVFYFRGIKHVVDQKGRIAVGSWDFSINWIFLGGSKHHWSTRPEVSLDDAFRDPQLLEGCLGWDRDHGTVRQWGGMYYGRLPRIRTPFVTSQRSEILR